MGITQAVDRINLWVAQSPVGRWFRLENSGHPKERKGSYFFTEIRAGLATFFAMAYIISVNSNITSESGGTCVCPPENQADLCNSNTEYLLCVQEVKRDLVTATAAIAALSTFCMGLFLQLACRLYCRIMGITQAVDRINLWVAQSPVGRWFRLENSGHPKERKGSYFFTEIRAGLATFFAMAYIISVNSNITSESGGTCVCPPENQADLCNSNTEYLLCVQEVKRDLVTATAAIAALSTFCMGLFSNLPVAFTVA